MRPYTILNKLTRAGRRFIVPALILLALSWAGLVFGLNPMARRTVETRTTAALNLRTTVESVSVHPLNQTVGFDDFRIASPAGFPTRDMLIVPSAEMNVAYSELRGEPVHITSITLIHPRLVIEGNATDVNLKVMVERIPYSIHPLHLIADRVTVLDATVVLRNLPGSRGEVSVPVETFTVNDIGANHADGATIKEALIRLVTSLAAHAADSPEMPAEYRAWIKGDIRQIVLTTLTAQVGRVLSDLLGRYDDGPTGRKIHALFDLSGLLGDGHAETTRPSQ